jgi:hypothetical protein
MPGTAVEASAPADTDRGRTVRSPQPWPALWPAATAGPSGQPHSALPRRPLRHLSGAPRRALHPRRHVGSRLLSRVRHALATDRPAPKAPGRRDTGRRVVRRAGQAVPHPRHRRRPLALYDRDRGDRLEGGMRARVRAGAVHGARPVRRVRHDAGSCRPLGPSGDRTGAAQRLLPSQPAARGDSTWPTTAARATATTSTTAAVACRRRTAPRRPSSSRAGGQATWQTWSGYRRPGSGPKPAGTMNQRASSGRREVQDRRSRPISC